MTRCSRSSTATRATSSSCWCRRRAGAGNGGGEHLANVFRRLDPLSRDVETASHLVAQRSVALRRLIGNLAKLATELGGNESELTAFVQGNEGVFRALAHQDQNLQQTIALLPQALGATNTALTAAATLGRTLQSTLGQLEPSARALGPTLSDLQAVLQRRPRPCSAISCGRSRSRLSPPPSCWRPRRTTWPRRRPGCRRSRRELNNIVNELAYKPPHGQSYLFYVPWASHNTNSVLASQDAIGPVRRSLILFSCGSLQLLQDLAKPTHNPTLATLIQLLTTPDLNSHCTAQGTPKK